MHDLTNSLVDALSQQRWCVIDNFFTRDITDALFSELQQHRQNHHLQAARIGKEAQLQFNQTVRGDSILWLDGASTAQRRYLDIMEELRCRLNRELFLGLHELESHFAFYPPGTGYKKHLDSFMNNNLRRITVVTYLNPTWSPDQGGELLLYNKNEESLATIEPRAGTLVCFVSEEFPHEVATTQAERASIAGWFRVRG